jgi:hypothetical protein
VAAALAGNGRVASGVDASQSLLLAALAVASPDVGAAQSIILTSEVEIELLSSSYPLAGGSLSIGFLDPVVRGAGFDFLLVEVARDGALLLAESFTDAAHALAFFDDRLIALGSPAFPNGVVNLSVRMTAAVSAPGDGFGLDLLVAVPEVPEPALGVLLGVAAVALAGRRRRRTRSRLEVLGRDGAQRPCIGAGRATDPEQGKSRA